MSLDSTAIAAWQAGPRLPLTVFRKIPSTNGYAKTYAASHAVTTAQAFLAEEQTAGYGKRGRTFYSPPATGVYLSLLVPAATVTPLAPGLLTTGTAVAVVTVLQCFFPAALFHVKWVNDILVDNKKCGGILVEQTHQAVVIGIGLNLFTPQFPAAIQTKAGAVTEQPVDRNIVIAGLLDALQALLPDYHTGMFLPAYRALAPMLGRPVTVQVGETVLAGTATAINTAGALVVTAADGQQHVLTAGEVTKVTLPANDYKG
ncbi:biotin--[acetyl-CoA-carboxylase] ligase [Schleiferilactobacillus harbinensis]|uniref:biotin--[biotin carboxyl-carrier protein] ligase n=1 Tax=Schleiferilactobacillus harbinensis DSM 16991 TaxID=1122147 RepID=A0A0R1XJ61_9LACO|nr:biotin--[acetyl-CoA-carboxylase] ligase [Schleiferilactobacillus harbinensis]KRM29725.1 biotin--[acetyl-CoA-carboxylase] ligase [Schleiferilactobacillus harbinensis DSM 16991]QFR63217.1 biotin--[acetyl-CoA-carboxylase] ligase [Schleiferilactobacillus harbinensis]